MISFWRIFFIVDICGVGAAIRGGGGGRDRLSLRGAATEAREELFVFVGHDDGGFQSFL